MPILCPPVPLRSWTASTYKGLKKFKRRSFRVAKIKVFAFKIKENTLKVESQHVLVSKVNFSYACLSTA